MENWKLFIKGDRGLVAAHFEVDFNFVWEINGNERRYRRRCRSLKSVTPCGLASEPSTELPDHPEIAHYTELLEMRCAGEAREGQRQDAFCGLFPN
jgi:hypothetical protein